MQSAEPADARPRGFAYGHRRRSAYTLIEILVVVAILAVLMSLLLPSLRQAREQARSVKCGTQLRDRGLGLHTYFAENDGWIPGVNTTGVTVWEHAGIAGFSNQDWVPVQTYDWMTPILHQSMELEATRAARFRELMNEFRCPAQATYRSVLYPPGLMQCVDRQDFLTEPDDWTTISYLMPVHFQHWGYNYEDEMLTTHVQSGTSFPIKTMPVGWEAAHPTYKSRLGRVGNPSRKIAVADGTRYLATNMLDTDPDQTPDWFGAFTSSGAWWCGSTAYGVRSYTDNWSGTRVSAAPWPYGQGRNLALSYRHGWQQSDATSGQASDNSGRINALFFDGSVRNLDDRESRAPSLWYPTGTIVSDYAAGEVMLDTLGPGDLIP